MPDQNTLTPTDLDALPIGSVVRDSEGDTYTRVSDDPNRIGTQWNRDGYPNPIWSAKEIADTSEYGPATLVSRPDQLDLYQQARIALRDRLGMEPTELDIVAVVDRMEHGNLTPAAAVTFWLHTRAETARQKAEIATLPDHMQPADTSLRRPKLITGFGLAVSGGGFAASVTVDTDDTVNGLARLRAHAALDALLDQHGVTR